MCAEPGMCRAECVQSQECAELGTGRRLALPWDPAGAGTEQEAPGRCLWDVQLLGLAWCSRPRWGRGRVLLRQLARGIHTARWGQGLHIPARPGEAGVGRAPLACRVQPCDRNWAQAASGMSRGGGGVG